MTRKLHEIYKEALQLVHQKKIEYQDLMFLFKDTFQIEDKEMILQENMCFDDTLFKARLERLLKDEPLAYILGYTTFLQQKFIVNSDVLIPRNETEELVLLAKDEIESFFIDDSVSIVDVGTGSGCIAISLESRLKSSKLVNLKKITAVDISKDALKVAKENAVINKSNVEWLESDCLEIIVKDKTKYNVIISNPPYIKKGNFVGASVLKYEPHLALYAENDGLAIIEKILSEAKSVITSKSLMFFEISPEQEEGLTELKNKYFPQGKIKFIKDMNGYIRFMEIICK